MALLDAVMEGLADAGNAGVRDICASAVREFLAWSLKQAPPARSQDRAKAGDRANLNANALLQCLFERLAQPEPYMRWGPVCNL